MTSTQEAPGVLHSELEQDLPDVVWGHTDGVGLIIRQGICHGLQGCPASCPRPCSSTDDVLEVSLQLHSGIFYQSFLQKTLYDGILCAKVKGRRALLTMKRSLRAFRLQHREQIIMLFLKNLVSSGANSWERMMLGSQTAQMLTAKPGMFEAALKFASRVVLS